MGANSLPKAVRGSATPGLDGRLRRSGPDNEIIALFFENSC